MKIYPKKLNSLEELKREKQVLLYAKKHTASQDLFSTDEIIQKAKQPAVDKTTDFMAIAGDLLTSSSTTNVAMTLGLPLIKMLGLKAGKGVFKGLFKEVFVGYMKWKLIHFGITTAVSMVKSKKEDKSIKTKRR
ncbi:MAG: hypothetical protein EOP56_03930 [Sphingobacteriales bacterium]|nr:MAG: hypothetical protein EOP56_03930 [Sphingobacteriales bacterium]